jgi:ribonuclease P protein component
MVLWREVPGGRRAGFAVSRHVRNAAGRNRVRRRLREAYRRSRAAAPARADLVIVGRPAVLTLGFEDLVAELRDALAAMSGVRRSA